MLKRAIIFVNGELCNGERIKAQINSQDFLIAVDGGYGHMKSLGLNPDLVIGDLDSMQKSDLKRLQTAGVEFLRFPPEKDETDLELALFEASARGYRDILLVAGLGGRLDQTLGNLFLPKAPFLQKCLIKMDDGCVEVWILRYSQSPGGLEILGEKGDVISLLVYGSKVKGIATQGLKYPLVGEDLWSYQTRGISNEMLAGIARVSITGGELIVIHTRQGQRFVRKLEA